LLPESFAAVENAENKMNSHPDASILHLSGDLHNYLDGLPKNAGQHQLKNGIVQHSFGFLAGVHVERTNSCIALHNLASFLPYGTLTVDCRAFL